MLKFTFRFSVLIILISVLTSGQTLKGSLSRGLGIKSGKVDNKTNLKQEQNAKGKSFAGTATSSATNKVRRGLGISAWGIISIIVTLIVSGMGFYYFSMCYPILCKKERNYDIIELQKV